MAAKGRLLSQDLLGCVLLAMGLRVVIATLDYIIIILFVLFHDVID